MMELLGYIIGCLFAVLVGVVTAKLIEEDQES
jgi:hypothetical protein